MAARAEARTGISERIETGRLILRPPQESDLDGWAALFADAEATEFLGGPQSRASAWRHMAMEAGSWRMKGYGMYSVLDKESGQWIGRCGPHWPDGYPGLELGWALLPSHWGRGLALEAARAAVDAVFCGTGCVQIIHLIDPANHRSIRIAERIGAAPGPRAALPPPYDQFTVDTWRTPRAVWARSNDDPGWRSANGNGKESA